MTEEHRKAVGMTTDQWHKPFTKSLTLTLPEPPSANRYWRYVSMQQAGKHVARVLLSGEARQYRKEVAAAYSQQIAMPFPVVAFKTEPLSMTIVWYRGRRAGDLGNREKQLSDALKGLAYRDDSQIVEIHLFRRDRPGNPGCTVKLEQIVPEKLDFFSESGE